MTTPTRVPEAHATQFQQPMTQTLAPARLQSPCGRPRVPAVAFWAAGKTGTTGLAARIALQRQPLQDSIRHTASIQGSGRCPCRSAGASGSGDAGAASSSAPSSSSTADPAPQAEDAAALARAQQRICEQQQAGTPPPWSLAQTQRLVESAMLAAVAGLAYTVSSLLRLESYAGYLLPLPAIIAAQRGGGRAALHTMAATCLLLLVLLGPIKAISYALIHGLLAVTLGTLWRWRARWALSVPAGTAVRAGGTLAYLSLSSWVMNENLFALLLTNVYSLLDQLCAAVGWSGAPPPGVVLAVLLSMLVVNCATYVFLMHVIYSLLLRGQGYDVQPPPPLVQRLMGRRTNATAS